MKIEVQPFLESKSNDFLIYATDTYKKFIAWRNLDGSITSIEILVDNYPPITVMQSIDIDDFIGKIDWLPYIIDGIQNKKLKVKVMNFLSSEMNSLNCDNCGRLINSRTYYNNQGLCDICIDIIN